MTSPDDAAAATPPGASPLLAPWLARRWPAVMGVLNLTPDSFSDGGRYDAPERALARARAMIAEGADIIDVGAESTRPYRGATPVDEAEEIRRLKPVLKAIVALGAPVSIDTMKPNVARFALDAGVAMLNDVWGLQRDPLMARVAADAAVPIVIMHNRASADPAIDIVRDMAAFFTRSLDLAGTASVRPHNIILDPGIGFGKTPQQSLTALARLKELDVFGHPVLVGASRKRFIASVSPSEPDQRLGGSIAAHLLAARNGARFIRAHDVAATLQALRVACAIEDSR